MLIIRVIHSSGGRGRERAGEGPTGEKGKKSQFERVRLNILGSFHLKRDLPI